MLKPFAYPEDATVHATLAETSAYASQYAELMCASMSL